MAPEAQFGDGNSTVDPIDLENLALLSEDEKIALIKGLHGEKIGLEQTIESLTAQLAEAREAADAKTSRRRSAKDDSEGYVVRERADRIVKVRHSSVVFRRDELITDPNKIALAREHGINLKKYVD